MKNKFNVIERFVTATPRSKRRAGGATSGGVVISGSEDSGIGAADPNSHTHANYELLENLSEQDGYLTLKSENTSDDPDAVPYIFEKIKAGYADNAGDAEKWDGHAFDDYLDQPLRKTDEVQFEAVIGSFRTPDFAGGMTGAGGRITSEGLGELEDLVVRRSLTVPELNYNRVEISVGDDWSAPGGGIIKEIDTSQQLVTLKLEDGERGAVAVGDICMGIFHSTTLSDNAAEDADDSRGNRTFAGFATAYFRITEVLGDHNEQFKYELRPVSTSYPAQIAPMISMKFVAYGSFTDASRRTSRYSTRTYQRYLRGVSDWEFTAENIAAQFGDLSNLAVFGLQMSGYSAYLDNIYMQGLLRSLDGPFIIDTKTRSLLMASGETGVGLAFNPEQGLKIGAVYDPETGKFQKEYDIEQIAKTANDTKEELDNLQYSVDNIVNGSHEDWVAAKFNASGFDAVDNVICLDHTLIRGKQITYRVELKGEAAQASQLGFEIKVHFTDNTDQWLARYTTPDIPDRGTFEKTYTFSSQIQDKEIEYARMYPVFRSLSGGEVSGKLYMRHEFVGVGNKLPSTWSPSIVDNIQIGGVNIFSLSDMEQGAINNSTGVPSASDRRLRSKSFQPISGKHISVNSFNSIYKFLWLFYDEEYSHIDNIVSWDWITSFPAVAEIPEGTAYVKYTIVRNDNAVLTPDDAKEDCLIKVELGNKPSLSWSPSIADQESKIPDLEYLKELFPASTEVDGAVIAQMLAVKDDTGLQIMGFINGSSDFSDPTHGICMIAMGISSITGWNSAKTRLYVDGHFVSASAEITGKITAQTGAIGPFTITTSYLTGTEGSSSLRLSSDLIRFTSGYGAAYIGKDTFPSSMGGSIISPARFEVSRIASSGEANAGIYISVSGATDYDDMIYSGNHALYIAKGDICGLRFRVRRVSSSQTLSEMDTFILVTASGTIDLTLPSSPQPGQLYFFKLIGSGKFNIKVGASGHYISNNRSDRITTWGFNSAPIIMLVWDRVNKIWHGGHLSVG